MGKKSVSIAASVLIVVLVSQLEAVQYAPEGTNRVTLNFNIGWKFHKGDVVGAENPSLDDSGWEDAHIPHTMEYATYHFPSSYDSFYRGIGWYRKHFTVPSGYNGRRVYIEFEGVMTVTDVWVNGDYMGKHYGGYTPFTFDITDSIIWGSSNNVIAVKVDNTYQTDVPPEGINTGKPDYALFGGLYRDVYLVFTDNLHIQDPVYAGNNGGGIFVTYPSVSSASATVNVKTWVYSASATSRDCTLVTTIADANNEIVATIQSSSPIGANTTHEFEQNTVVSNPNLWSPSNPYLYTVYTTVRDGSTPVDDYKTRIGIRSILFDYDTGFYINGEHLKLIGSCRHQTWPFVGSAVPNSAHYRDAKMMKDGGMNFVRLSHYTHDPSFYDAADELGFLLWDEIPSWQGPSSDPVWRERNYQNMRDMIRRNRNHPSVIIYAGINEGSQDTAMEIILNDIAHLLDPTRYTSMARNYNTSNNIYDVYGRNYGHSSNPDSSTDGFVESEYSGWMNPCHRYDSDTQNVSFAETYENVVEAHNDRPWVAGGTGWCMFDYQTPFTYQNKWEDGVAYHGAVDLFRIPKFAYYFYQSQRDPNKPMIFIANYWTLSSPTNVKVYSNCEQVELFINDVSQGLQSPDIRNLDHPPFTFSVSFQPGKLRADGLIGGQVVASHTVRTPGATTALHLEADPPMIAADGSDFARVIISVVDSNGTVIRNASNTVDLSVTSGPGILIGGNPDTSPPLDIEGGMFAVLVQSTLTAGTIAVTATSIGLAPATVEITSYCSGSPVANDDYYNTVPDVTLNIDADSGVLFNDAGCTGTLTASLVAGPLHGTLTFDANGAFEYDPNAGYIGDDSFTYKANDGEANSNTATVYIDVLDPHPVANDDNYVAVQGIVLSVDANSGVLANDYSPGGLPNAILVSPPTNGSLTLNSNGSFEYTPNAGFIGDDIFTYKANWSGYDSNVATVFISVVSKVPVGWWKLNDGSGSTAENSGDRGSSNDGTLINMDDSDWVGGRIAGALEFDGSDDYVSVPALNLNSNTVTISAWIKRNGEQAESYTGIVFTRDASSIAGLGFGGTGPPDWAINNELAYNWNDDMDAWNFHSGLVIPDGEWVFVAVVVEPTKATLYLAEPNDAPPYDYYLRSVINTINHSIEEFDGVTRIAHDMQSTGRHFKGRIDDVRIYSRALSPSEIEQLAYYVPDLIDNVADSDIAVSGTVSGSYIDTRSGNNVYEAIREIESLGSPATRYSYLEHKWTIDVTGHDTVTFYIQAHHTANVEGDDFIFAYSMDDSNYIDMLTIAKTSDDDTYQNYEMPNDISGTVYIRVRDTDRTAGNRVLDTIYIDHMFIRSEAAGPDADFNGDGVVNFLDYADFAAAWMTSIGEPGFNEIYDLDDNDTVDMPDLGIFSNDWLRGI